MYQLWYLYRDASRAQMIWQALPPESPHTLLRIPVLHLPPFQAQFLLTKPVPPPLPSPARRATMPTIHLSLFPISAMPFLRLSLLFGSLIAPL